MNEVYITEEQKQYIRNFILKNEVSEETVPTAQDQVHNKVNSGIMDAICANGMMEGAEPENDKYQIGFEDGANSFAHINESKEIYDFKKDLMPIAKFMKKSGLNVYPFPKVILNWDEQDGLFIKTGYYEPQSKTIHIFCKDRHPKDILRTYAHEMIHHSQNLDGKDLSFDTTNVKDNARLEKIEGEAYLKGNIYFRKWTEYENSHQKKALKESVGELDEIADVSDLNIMMCASYYEDEGARELCHAMKNGNINALKRAASEMSKFVSSDSILVPLPSRNGIATTTLTLAKLISKNTGAHIENILNGNKRESLYDLKHNGFEAKNHFFGYKSKSIPENLLSRMILIDNVLDTGATVRAASDATGIKNILVYAKSNTIQLNENFDLKSLKNGININVDEKDWINLIFDKKKTIETRSKRTFSQWAKHKGETVGIVKTTRKPTKSNPTGMLVGYATIQDVIQYDSQTFDKDYDKHLVEPHSEFYNTDRCGIVLSNVVKLDTPIKLKGGTLQSVRPIKYDDTFNSIEESITPDEVDLSSFNIKKNLNPKFWKNDLLDSRIRIKLLDIADDFIEFMGVDWVKPDDIIMTGSLANFNWNKQYSDIDLHILIDYSKVDKRKDFVKNYFDAQKKLWNKEHKDLKIMGFTVELYVQDTNEKHSSTGVYSLEKNEWIKEPSREDLVKSKVNKGEIRTKVSKFINNIDKLSEELDKINSDDEYELRKLSNKLEDIADKIYCERSNGLKEKDNEISNGNILFKTLRRMNYIEKLNDLKTEVYNKMNSLS